jgi:hypothetical protein
MGCTGSIEAAFLAGGFSDPANETAEAIDIQKTGRCRSMEGSFMQWMAIVPAVCMVSRHPRAEKHSSTRATQKIFIVVSLTHQRRVPIPERQL